MNLCESERLLLKALHLAGGMPTTKELSDYLPEAMAKAKGLSSRLCDLRKKGMVHSEMSEVGVNHWALTADGADALLVAPYSPDTDDAPEPAVCEPIQADSPDISPDIYDDSDSIAATVATALEEFNALGTPFCADMDPAGVSDDLVEEANSLRLQSPFPHLKAALYVLAVLADLIGDRPAMVHELDRIADYLEREAA